MSASAIEAHLSELEPQGDSIDTWLAVLVRLLDISSSKRDAIRDEIEAHLRERVRDLMIAGMPEHDAIRIAINELGEVADLARRFSHASKLRTRRIIMNAAVLAVGGVSVAMATVFLNGPQPNSRVAVFNAQPPAAAANQSAILDDHKVEANFEQTRLGDTLEFLATTAGADLVIDRNELEQRGVSLEEPITLHLSTARPISQVLKLVAQQTEPQLAWRVHDNILEVATSEVFDRREVVLAAFDVQNVLDRIYEDTGDADEATSRLQSLVIDYVEPDAWYDNGGELATLRIVGGRMFVKAPSRFHQPIEWMLSQLEDSATQHAERLDRLGGSFGSGQAGWRIYSDSLNTLGRGASPFGSPVAAPTTPVPSPAGAPSAPSDLTPPAEPIGVPSSAPSTGSGQPFGSPAASSTTGGAGSFGSGGEGSTQPTSPANSSGGGGK